MNNNSADNLTRIRTRPLPWDYSWFLTRNNIHVFNLFLNRLDKKNSKLLDVGCGSCPFLNLIYKHSPDIKYYGIDSDSNSHANYIASASKIDFEDNYFDALIYSEVFEHVFDIEAALHELRRVAKNGAYVYISTPFIFPLHGIPDDYRRITSYWYRNTFHADEIIVLCESNSIFSIPFLTLNIIVEMCLNRSIFLRLFRNFVCLAVNCFTYFIELLVSVLSRTLFLKKYHHYIYSMPLGYGAIIKIIK